MKDWWESIGLSKCSVICPNVDEIHNMIKRKIKGLNDICRGHWKNRRCAWGNFQPWINHHLGLKSLFKSQCSDAELFLITSNDRQGFLGMCTEASNPKPTPAQSGFPTPCRQQAHQEEAQLTGRTWTPSQSMIGLLSLRTKIATTILYWLILGQDYGTNLSLPGTKITNSFHIAYWTAIKW